MRVPCLFGCLALFVSSLSAPAWAQSEIGRTVSAQNDVVGAIEAAERDLQAGDAVFQDETITTGSNSKAGFRFADGTTMSMGAATEVVLDRYVYDPATTNGDVVLNAVTGAFRFVTGSASANNFRVVTRYSVLGIRGTEWDHYVTPRGVLVLIRDGGDEIFCPRRFQNELDQNPVECCRMGTRGTGQPVYGVILQGEDRCIGPTPWDGTNPLTILGRLQSWNGVPDEFDEENNDGRTDPPRERERVPARQRDQDPDTDCGNCID